MNKYFLAIPILCMLIATALPNKSQIDWTSKLIELQPGTITITEPIVITKSGTVLNGNGAKIRMMGEGPAIIFQNPAGIPIRYCSVSNLEIHGGGILVENATDCSLKDLYIHNVDGIGLEMRYCWANRLDNIKSTANTEHGLRLFKTTASVITGGRYAANQGDGIRVSGSTTVLKMVGVGMEGNKGWGYKYDRGPSNKGTSHNISFDTVYMEGNDLGGISIETSENWSIAVVDSRLDTPVRINAFDGRYEHNHELSNTVDGELGTIVELTGKGWTSSIREGHYLRAPAFSHMETNHFDSFKAIGK